jgi:hypothetical protein
VGLVPAAALVVMSRVGAASDFPSLVLVTAARTALPNISSGDLRQLFLGESVRDRTNQKLVPLNQQAGSAERSVFDDRVLGMSQNEMAGYWIDQKVRGLKGPPRNLAPAQMVARVVERFPGAVSYLRPEHVIPGLKVVRIDNVEAGSEGYVLTGRGRK